jgi:hypothetical protein
MSFDTHGFFSPEIAKFQMFVRSQPESKPWFALADDLNRLCLNLLRVHETPLDNRALLTLSAAFVRAHQSYQAGIVLTERGMIGDARTVLRSATESAIAIQALSKDPSFVDQIVGAYHNDQRKLAGVVLRNRDYQAIYSNDQITQMKATVTDVNRMSADSPTRPAKVNWEQVAQEHCPDLYQLIYRLLSSDGTHLNANSLTHYFAFDANQRITALKVAPDAEGLVEALRLACMTILWALEAFERAFPSERLATEIQARLRRFKELPEDEIGRAEPLS